MTQGYIPAKGDIVWLEFVKSFDWKARKANYICALPNKQLKEVLGKLRVLL